MKISVTAPFREQFRKIIKESAEGEEIIFTDNPELIYDSDIIIGDVKADDFRKCSQLKWLQSTNAGVEKFCKENILPENVIITNVTGAFGEVISEYVIGGLLALFRDFYSYKDNQRGRIWRDTGKERMIYGSNVLILGCGNIGTSIAARLTNFGADITGISKSGKPVKYFDRVYTAEMLHSVISKADIIIGCLPHTPDTDKMLNKKILNQCKSSAVIANVGRGSLIEMPAMIEMLKSGRLYGAVLDVFPQEPLDTDSELWEMDNVIITPHISGCSFNHSISTESAIAKLCAYNLKQYLNGKPLTNVIDRSKGYV